MAFAVELSGPRDPLMATPKLPIGWIRRTTSIDVNRADLYGPGDLDMRGRTVINDVDGQPTRVLDAAHMVAKVDPAGAVISLTAVAGDDPPTPEQLDGFKGASTGAGFRKVVAGCIGDEMEKGSLWHLLIDDLVGAVLVSGVAPQHIEAKSGGGPIEDSARDYADLMRLTMADICAGWATDATMLRVFAVDDRLPVACGPEAPHINGPEGGWHEVELLPANGVRRRRRLDVSPPQVDAMVQFDVHFRDEHVDDAGIARVVHEYSVSGTADSTDDHRITTIKATARVLPWQECPGAIGSERRLVGVAPSEVRALVRSDLRGISTCTHLNDTLRSLGDLGTLAAASTADS